MFNFWRKRKKFYPYESRLLEIPNVELATRIDVNIAVKLAMAKVYKKYNVQDISYHMVLGFATDNWGNWFWVSGKNRHTEQEAIHDMNVAITAIETFIRASIGNPVYQVSLTEPTKFLGYEV